MRAFVFKFKGQNLGELKGKKKAMIYAKKVVVIIIRRVWSRFKLLYVISWFERRVRVGVGVQLQETKKRKNKKVGAGHMRQKCL